MFEKRYNYFDGKPCLFVKNQYNKSKMTRYAQV